MWRRRSRFDIGRNDPADSTTRTSQALRIEPLGSQHVEELTQLMYAMAVRNPRSLFFFEPHGDFGFWRIAGSRSTTPTTARQQNKLRDFLRLRVQMQARGESITHVAQHEGRAVGFVSVDAMTPCEAAVSYFFADRSARVRPRGSATTAVHGAVLDAFRRQPKLDRIYGLVASNNIRSVKILRRLRFQSGAQITSDHWAQRNIDEAADLWQRGLSNGGQPLIPQPGKTLAMLLTRDRIFSQ